VHRITIDQRGAAGADLYAPLISMGAPATLINAATLIIDVGGAGAGMGSAGLLILSCVWLPPG